MRTINFCTVLRPADGKDCTGGGITAKNSMVSVVIDVPYNTMEHDGQTYYGKPDEALIEEYVRKNSLDPKKVVFLCDKTNNPIYTPYLKPLDSVWGKAPDGTKLVGPCAGGNYVKYHDGGEKIIRVHDRYDTEKAWDWLSR